MCDLYEKLGVAKILDDLKNPNYVFDEPNAMDYYEKYGFVKKDCFDGDIVKIVGIADGDKSTINLQCEGGVTIPCNLKKDREFFKIKELCTSTNIEEIKYFLASKEGKDWFENNEISVMLEKTQNKEFAASFMNSHITEKSNEFFAQIKKSTKSYNAKVIGKNTGGFIVNIEGIPAFLPGGQAAANKITAFDSYIGKIVPVMIEDYIREGSTFIVSNKKYIRETLPIKIKELQLDVPYTGTITGNVAFGIFVEFEDIFTGLLHMSEMDMVTMEQFRNKEFVAGDEMEFYIKEIADNNKIILTKLLLEERQKEFTFDDFKRDFEFKIEEGEIINIKENLGVFVRFTRNNKQFIGLLYFKEVDDINEFVVGEMREFYISKIIPDIKKIFLKIPIYGR